MNILNHFNRHAVLLTGALLLCASIGAYADDIEDANQLFKQGQRSQALDKVNGYLANKPKDAQARFLKGLILTEQGQTADAIKIFSALTDDYPELPEPYNNLAVLYAGQGQYDKARLLLEMAISTHPSYATAHENLGDIYAKMASQAYDKALALGTTSSATKSKLTLLRTFSSSTGSKVTVPELPAQAAPAPAPTQAAANAPVQLISPVKPDAGKSSQSSPQNGQVIVSPVRPAPSA